MKTIVCYGDSNTWGFMPKLERPVVSALNRYPWGVRWTSLLQMKLGADYRVEEEGLNGRTTMFDDPMEPGRNGLAMVDMCMRMKHPADLVILMLGTNDVKALFNLPLYGIAGGCGQLVDRILAGGYGLGGNAPQVLLVAPPRLHPALVDGWLREEFGPAAMDRNDQLPELYAAVAREKGVHFLNAAAFVTADPADGIHLNAEGHAALAECIHEKVVEILG